MNRIVELKKATRCYVGYAPNFNPAMVVYFDHFDSYGNFVDSRGAVWFNWRVAPKRQAWNEDVFEECVGAV